MSEPTEAEKIRRLNWRLAHNGANTIFVQLTFFGSLYILFLSELGLPKARIGFLLSLVPLCGVVSLVLASPVARAGVKRVFIVCWTLRSIDAGFLLLTPWILSRFGAETTFYYIILLIIVFAFCRAVGETGAVSWEQEVIPARRRGKFRGISTIVETLAAVFAIAVASLALRHIADLYRFIVPMGIGAAFGLLSVGFALFSPGGAPVGEHDTDLFRQMRIALRDRNFRYHLGSQGLVILSFGFVSFIPLFMKEQVGLREDQIVLLQAGSFAGAVLSSYMWGWVADRYGSKPVILSALNLMALVPLCFLFMPRHEEWSYAVAISIAFLGGVASSGWGVSDYRLIYTDIIPRENKTQYTAIYYAWWGLMGGVGQLLAGGALDLFKGLSGRFLIFGLDPYSPLFITSPLLLVFATLMLRQLRLESGLSSGSFMSMFLRGNPFRAFRALVRYRSARDERMRIQETAHLGDARSPFSVEELLEALADPSFQVRYEAVISIARTRPDNRLVDALIRLVSTNVPDLGPPAAWALGRMGADRAIPSLREALESDYPLLRASSARSLAALGDVDGVPALIKKFRTETDSGLRVAYAAALGMLRANGVAGDLVTELHYQEDEKVRGELALALARLVDEERDFVQFWRQADGELGTALARQIGRLPRSFRNANRIQIGFSAACAACAEVLAQGDLEKSASLLIDVGKAMKQEMEPDTLTAELLSRYAEILHTPEGAVRKEYLILESLTVQSVIKKSWKRPSLEGTA